MTLRFTCILLLFTFSANAQNSVIETRLTRLTDQISLDYNKIVENEIYALTDGNKQSTNQVLGLSALYLDEIEDSLTKYGLPKDLKYLVPALSGYDNWRVSSEGGSGFWQLKYLIARRYGIRISSYIDERRDYQKATHAAIQYLNHLHSVYSDWLFAIAAFECDEVEVNKAIRMAKGSTDFWEVYPFLPIRCQRTVPKFIAQVYIHSYYDMHNLKPIVRSKPILADVEIQQWTTLFQLSQALDIDYDSLKDYNPIFKRQVIPKSGTTYFAKIPANRTALFYDLGDSVYTFRSYKNSDLIENPEVEQVPEPSVNEDQITKNNETTSTTSSSGTKLIYYTVRSGDYLGRIADLYDVGLSNLRRWNGISGDKINVNQRLKIYVNASDYDKYKGYNALSASQKKAIMAKD